MVSTATLKKPGAERGSGAPAVFSLGPERGAPARRVVSLVPSLTEALCQLEAASLLRGRTRYCVAPAAQVASVPAVGGTKDPDVGFILSLAPDLVLAAKEENRKQDIRQVAAQVPVLVVDPAGPAEVPAVWRALGAAVDRQALAETRAQEVEALLTPGQPGWTPLPCLYFIWQQPWMVAGPDTYVSRLLSSCGFSNPLPANRRRYPIVTAEQALGSEVAVHLYSDEPFPFALPDHLAAWGVEVSAQGDGKGWMLAHRIRCRLVCGADFTWYPSRTAEGLRQGRALRAAVASS